MTALAEFWKISYESHDKWRWLTASQRLMDAAKMDVMVLDHVARGVIKPKEPVPFRVNGGRYDPDFYPNGCWGFNVLSKRLTEAIESVKPRGLHKYRAVIYDKKDTQIVRDDVFLVQLEEGCGPVDDERGAPLLVEPGYRKTDPMLERAIGLFFDPATWTGLDLFHPAARGFDSTFLVTTRVANAIRPIALKGVLIERADLVGTQLREMQFEHDARMAGPPKPGPSPFERS